MSAPRERTRVLTTDDAPRLATLLAENREFLAPWDPRRAPAFFTVQGQERSLAAALEGWERGITLPLGILDDDGALVGRLTLNCITRGAFQSAAMGYWVAENHNGRGLATAAVAEAVQMAFDGLALHRLQAETLPHNVPSQRVLTKNGFERYGVAPDYLKIDGRWQEHVLYQRIAACDPELTHQGTRRSNAWVRT